MSKNTHIYFIIFKKVVQNYYAERYDLHIHISKSIFPQLFCYLLKINFCEICFNAFWLVAYLPFIGSDQIVCLNICLITQTSNF